MPGPTTEILNDDIKELKADGKGLREDIHGLDRRIVRVEVKVGLALVLLVASVGSVFGGIGAGSWWASALTSRMNFLEQRVGGMDARFDKVDARLDRIDGQLNRLDAQFNRIDAQLAEIRKAIVPAKPAP